MKDIGLKHWIIFFVNLFRDIDRFKKFKVLGQDYAFTYVGDNICQYNFGFLYYENDILIKDTRQYWHKMIFGFYRRSESWIS